MRIVLTGGGEGGHLMPFEPIVKALRENFEEVKNKLPLWLDRSELEIYFLGVASAETKKMFRRLGVEVTNVPAAKLRRYASALTISDFVWWLPIGFLKSAWLMWWIMPDVVISKGGYGSLPIIMAAILYRIPYLIHESDAIPGLSTRIAAPGAIAITVGMADTRHRLSKYQKKTIVTGTPVREGLMKHTPEEARRIFGWGNEKPVLLVMGGSQGAEQINDLLIAALPSLLKDMRIIHITGEKNLAAVKEEAAERLSRQPNKDDYKIFGFLTETMGDALMAADVVVSRAGATALAELSKLRKAAILIPLEGAAQDHQRHNADLYERAEAVRVIGTENIGPTLFEQNIRDLMANEEFRELMRNNIASLDYPNAAEDIARLAINLGMGLAPRQPEDAPPGMKKAKNAGPKQEKSNESTVK